MFSQQINTYLSSNSGALYALLAINVLLILVAPYLVRRFSAADASDAALEFRVNVIRGLNVLAIGLLGHFRFYGGGQSGQGIGVKILSILVIIYLSYLTVHLIGRFVRLRFGRAVQNVGSGPRIADTYASRALSIFFSVFIGIMALISIIRVAGFSSLLEAGGVIGFVGVFLALTQGAWAPDIISGLVILNSKMFKERDVIKISDGNEEMLAIVYRTLAFHTELLNLVDNHRVMIRNSKIRDQTVHNLSRFASARGLRETMLFKIGYDVSPAKVKAMFESAFQAAVTDPQIPIEEQHPLEVRLKDTGDHAIEWSVHYYTKDEFALIKTKQFFREKILTASLEFGISLSTPFTHQAQSVSELQNAERLNNETVVDEPRFNDSPE